MRFSRKSTRSRGVQRNVDDSECVVLDGIAYCIAVCALVVGAGYAVRERKLGDAFTVSHYDARHHGYAIGRGR
jgi:hypothetical protein